MVKGVKCSSCKRVKCVCSPKVETPNVVEKTQSSDENPPSPKVETKTQKVKQLSPEDKAIADMEAKLKLLKEKKKVAVVSKKQTEWVEKYQAHLKDNGIEDTSAGKAMYMSLRPYPQTPTAKPKVSKKGESVPKPEKGKGCNGRMWMALGGEWVIPTRCDKAICGEGLCRKHLNQHQRGKLKDGLMGDPKHQHPQEFINTLINHPTMGQMNKDELGLQ
jgi:hypothetical protein